MQAKVGEAEAVLAAYRDSPRLASTLTGALAYAGVTLTTKSMRGTPPHLTALVHCMTGALLLAAFSKIPAGGLSAAQWGWLGTLGLVPTAIAYVMIYGATPRMETAAIAVLTFIYPATAVCWDYLVYGHLISATLRTASTVPRAP